MRVSYSDRLVYAKTLEQMRRELEHLNVGSKLNTLSAMDSRAEMQRGPGRRTGDIAGGSA